MRYREIVRRSPLIGLCATAALGLSLAGCVLETRVARFGRLPGNHSLVTLVVSEDREVVARECSNVPATGPLLGCQISWPIRTPGALPVRAVKIVRYTDSLPSPLAFEIDAHELCHAVAALQLVEDPCHQGNGGMAQAAADPVNFR